MNVFILVIWLSPTVPRVEESVDCLKCASAVYLTVIRDLLLPMFAGGDDDGGHVVHMSRRLLERVQLLIVAISLHL